MILEKLNNKMNPKKTIYRSSWKLEADKIAGQKLEAWGWEVRRREEGEREGKD